MKRTRARRLAPLLALALSLAPIPAAAQLRIAPDSGGLQALPVPGEAPPAAADPGADAPAPDLLSRHQETGKGRPLWVTRLLGLLGAGGSPARHASRAYDAGDYDLSLQKYAEAMLDDPGSQALAYNAGNAHFRKRAYDDAIAAFKKALKGDDAGLAASAYYNLGNAQFRKGEASVQAGRQEGIEDYREAMAAYKKSLEIRPDNRDAKRNIEVVQARIKELLERQDQQQQQQHDNPQPPVEPSPEAKQALARAMQLVAERRYAEAKTLLEDLIQRDRTAASYQSHVQRIDDVIKILRGEAPTPPRRQDPRAAQPGVGVI